MAVKWTDGELAFFAEAFDLARSGRSSELIALVRAGLPVDLTNSSGDTLLILAAYYDHPDTVVALLAGGADTGGVNDRGQTALAAAVFRRSVASVTALLRAGADPALGGRSAVLVAGFFGLNDMLELLNTPPGEPPSAP